jgi:hypothetical protein
MNDFDHIPDDVLQAAAVLALKQIRGERDDCAWVPTFHNRGDFEERILKIVSGSF